MPCSFIKTLDKHPFHWKTSYNGASLSGRAPALCSQGLFLRSCTVAIAYVLDRHPHESGNSLKKEPDHNLCSFRTWHGSSHIRCEGSQSGPRKKCFRKTDWQNDLDWAWRMCSPSLRKRDEQKNTLALLTHLPNIWESKQIYCHFPCGFLKQDLAMEFTVTSLWFYFFL